MKPYYTYCPVVLSCLFLCYFILEYAVGFYVIDDWNYILSFQYLAAGDYSVLWAAVCEHRPVFAKLFHYISYCLGYDGKPLLFLSQFSRLATAFILIKHLSEQLKFSQDTPGKLSKIAAASAVAIILFSPVQAWAISRATYVECYICVIGAVMVISGAIGCRWWLSVTGLILSAISTPGWLALVPSFTVISLFILLSPRDGYRRIRLKFSLTTLFLLICFLFIYNLPFSHPNEHLYCAKKSTWDMLSLFFTDTAYVLNHFVALLGFPMGWIPDWFNSRTAVEYEATFRSAYIAGIIYLLLNFHFFWTYIRHRTGSLFAVSILLWTLMMAGAITLSRVKVMGEVFVVNYMYPVYLTTGWATLLFLAIHRATRPLSSNTNLQLIKNGLVIGSVFILLILSYPKGVKALKETMAGMTYMQKIYYDGFIKKSVKEKKIDEIAEIIYPPYPNTIREGTKMLEKLRGIPDSWKE